MDSPARTGIAGRGHFADAFLDPYAGFAAVTASVLVTFALGAVTAYLLIAPRSFVPAVVVAALIASVASGMVTWLREARAPSVLGEVGDWAAHVPSLSIAGYAVLTWVPCPLFTIVRARSGALAAACACAINWITVAGVGFGVTALG